MPIYRTHYLLNLDLAFVLSLYKSTPSSWRHSTLLLILVPGITSSHSSINLPKKGELWVRSLSALLSMALNLSKGMHFNTTDDPFRFPLKMRPNPPMYCFRMSVILYLFSNLSLACIFFNNKTIINDQAYNILSIVVKFNQLVVRYE